MKKITKILSVILCVLTVLSSANIFSFAADETAENETVSSETADAETAQKEKTDDEENMPEKEETSADTEDASQTDTDNKKKKFTYAQCLSDVAELSIEGLKCAVTVPAGITALTVAFLPTIILLPVLLPPAAAVGLGGSALGAFGLVFSPLLALFFYVFQ